MWNLTQNSRREMKTSRGRGNRASRMTKNSLVARRVFLIAGSGDIRRQRHGTAGIKIDTFLQCDNALAIGCNFLNPQSNIVDLRRRANAHFASRLDQAFPASGERTRLACCDWHPRQLPGTFGRAGPALRCEGSPRRRRERHARRVRSPEKKLHSGAKFWMIAANDRASSRFGYRSA